MDCIVIHIYLVFSLFFLIFTESFSDKIINNGDLVTLDKKHLESILTTKGLGGVIKVLSLMKNEDYSQFSQLIFTWEAGKIEKDAILNYLKVWIKKENYGMDGSIYCLKNENSTVLLNECNNIFKNALTAATELIFFRRFIEKKIFDRFTDQGFYFKKILKKFYDELNLKQKIMYYNIYSYFTQPPASSKCSPYKRIMYIENKNVTKSYCQATFNNFDKDIGEDDVIEVLLTNQLSQMVSNEEIMPFLDNNSNRDIGFKQALKNFEELYKSMSTIPLYKRWPKFLTNRKYYSVDFIDSITSFSNTVFHEIISDNIKQFKISNKKDNYELLFSALNFMIKGGEYISKNKTYLFKKKIEDMLSVLKKGMTISNLGLNIGKFIYETSISNALSLFKAVTSFASLPLDYVLKKEYKTINEAMVKIKDKKYKNSKIIKKESEKAEFLLVFKSSYMMLGSITCLLQAFLGVMAASSPWIIATIPLALISAIITSIGVKKIIRKYKSIAYLKKIWNTSKRYTLPPILQKHENEISKFGIRLTWVFIAHLNVSIFNFIENLRKKILIESNEHFYKLYYIINNAEWATIKLLSSYAKNKRKKVNLNLNKYKKKYINIILQLLVEPSGILDFLIYSLRDGQYSLTMNMFFENLWKHYNSRIVFNTETGLGKLAQYFNEDIIHRTMTESSNLHFLYFNKHKEKLKTEIRTNKVILELLTKSVFDWKILKMWSFWFGYKKIDRYFTSSSWAPRYIPGVLIYCFIGAIISSKNLEEFSLRFVVLYSYFVFMSLPASFNVMVEYVETLSAASYIRKLVRDQIMLSYYRGIIIHKYFPHNLFLNKLLQLDLDIREDHKLINLFSSKLKDVFKPGNVLRFLRIKENKVHDIIVEIKKKNNKKEGGVYVKVIDLNGHYNIKLFTRDELTNWKWDYICSLYGKDEKVLLKKKEINISRDYEEFNAIIIMLNDQNVLKNRYISFKLLQINENENLVINTATSCIVNMNNDIIVVERECFFKSYSWRLDKPIKNGFNFNYFFQNEMNVKLLDKTYLSKEIPKINTNISYNLAEQSKLVTLNDVNIAENIASSVLNQFHYFFKMLKDKTVFGKDKSQLIAGNILNLKEKDIDESSHLIIEILKVKNNKNYEVKIYEENEDKIDNWTIRMFKKYLWMLQFQKYNQSESSLVKGNIIQLLSKTGLPTKDLPALFDTTIVHADSTRCIFNFTKFDNISNTTKEVSFTAYIYELKQEYRWRDIEENVLLLV